MPLLSLIAITYLHSEDQAERHGTSVVALATVTARLNVISWIVLVSFPFIQVSHDAAGDTHNV